MLSGGASAAQVAGNAAARLLDLPAEVAAALDALAEDPAGYRSARSARPWS